MPTITGSITDPEFRKRRARLAGKAAHGVDSLIKQVVQRAPELRPEHVEQLRALLPPADR